MKVLIACEFSQIVTKAFRDKGHEAYSCDLLPTEGNPDWHIRGDVLEILNDGWDLMIAHPPYTYLSLAANRVWNTPGRSEKREKAFDFFMLLYGAPIEHICIENPISYMNTRFRKPDQIVQPYYFGDREMKTTCLWLKNLPLLQHFPENTLFDNRTHTKKPKPIYISPKGKNEYFTTASDFKGKNRQLERSRTFQGIAKAMATQWGEDTRK